MNRKNNGTPGAGYPALTRIRHIPAKYNGRALRVPTPADIVGARIARPLLSDTLNQIAIIYFDLAEWPRIFPGQAGISLSL